MINLTANLIIHKLYWNLREKLCIPIKKQEHVNEMRAESASFLEMSSPAAEKIILEGHYEKKGNDIKESK